MNNDIKSKGGLINLKKKYYKQFLTENANNINVLNSVNIPYSFNNYQCMCDCHEEKVMNNNNLHNYNSEIYISGSKLDKRQYQQIPFGRNKSSNYLLALKNKDLSLDPSKIYSTNYNYNFNYFDNVENGILNKKPKSQEKMNNLYQNEKINICLTDNVEKTDNLQKSCSMNEIQNNLSKRSIVHKNKKENKTENKNENKSMFEDDINKNILYRFYHDAKPKKYSYGGRTIIVSSNAKNHSFKEIIVKSGSSDKIMNKKNFIKLTENNIYNNINNNNYNDNNYYKSSNNIEINNDMNYNYNSDKDKNENNNINHREIKKSTSENYLFNHHHIHHFHRCRCHCINHMNYFGDINNCNQNNDIHLMANNKDKYKLNIYDYCKNDNLLTYEKENKNNNICTPVQTLNNDNNNNKYHMPIEVFNSENSEIFNNCNNNKYNYNFNGQNYYYKNKRTIPKSNSFDNYNILKKTYKNTIVTPKNSAIWDFNYNNFKLKVKLGLLKNEIYKNEKNNKNGNKNRIKLNYQQDKKYLENILNNKKKSNIKDIVLEKTKKALEEKKLKQENKYNNNKNQKKYKYRYKNENQILSNLKKQLLENNKKNNRYIVKPKLNVFK